MPLQAMQILQLTTVQMWWLDGFLAVVVTSGQELAEAEEATLDLWHPWRPNLCLVEKR